MFVTTSVSYNRVFIITDLVITEFYCIYLFNLVCPFDDDSLNVVLQRHIAFFTVGLANDCLLLLDAGSSLLTIRRQLLNLFHNSGSLFSQQMSSFVYHIYFRQNHIKLLQSWVRFEKKISYPNRDLLLVDFRASEKELRYVEKVGEGLNHYRYR